jgi:uncharacterized Zn-binding protein involved in type VI secretion
MGQPAAKQDDDVIAVDTHIVMVPTPGGPVPTPLPHPFTGKLASDLVATVKIGGKPAATVDSVANNQPAHIATPPGTSFQSPPKDQGKVMMGSGTVKIGGKAAARMGDTVETCNDPSNMPVGSIIAAGTVMVGG